MYDDRYSLQFVEGVHTFLLAAEANKQADGFMPCPCAGCKNGHNYSTSRTILVHLFESGFMPHYNVWTEHGEIGVMMEDSKEEEDDDNYVTPEYGDAATGEVAEDQEEPDDVPNDAARGGSC